MAEKAKKSMLRIELTLEQKEQIKQATGLDVSALELTPEALEERIAPADVFAAKIQGCLRSGSGRPHAPGYHHRSARSSRSAASRRCPTRERRGP